MKGLRQGIVLLAIDLPGKVVWPKDATIQIADVLVPLWMKQFLKGVFILFLFREAFFLDPLHQRNRPLTALHQVQHKEVSKHRVHWIRCFSDWWSGPVRSPCFGVYLRGTSKKHHTYVAIIPGCLRILASKAVPRGCNPDVCDPKIYSCNTTCWHGVSLQSSHIYRNIYIVEHILYSI